ncbi:30S ribosomal protein S6 [Buchnera aphidicola (Neophyllaphis podocarpi)]|uniref:30S ribosomal protein S6 n=1 Tax=Buchnera aphidicola TaxID=9 RepID=UPI003464A05F
MRHYEIILIIHPDQSEEITSIVQNYKKIIKDNNGILHRLEDWGRRQLSYTINKLHKAHYILMNLEVDLNTIKKLEDNFRFNKYIIRNLIIKVKKAYTEISPIAKLKDDNFDKKDIIQNKSFVSL